MIPEAREVHLSRKDRKVLEACCRSPLTLQRDLKRARIVLLAAAGRSTRSIAKEVGVQPRIVSRWRHRYAAIDALSFLAEPFDEACSVGDLALSLRERLTLLSCHDGAEIVLVRHHQVEP